MHAHLPPLSTSPRSICSDPFKGWSKPNHAIRRLVLAGNTVSIVAGLRSLYLAQHSTCTFGQNHGTPLRHIHFDTSRPIIIDRRKWFRPTNCTSI